MAKRSPPIPFMSGSITPRAALAAIAASTAEPPRPRISAPAWDARTWLVATIPYLLMTMLRALGRSWDAAREAKAIMNRVISFLRMINVLSSRRNQAYWRRDAPTTASATPALRLVLPFAAYHGSFNFYVDQLRWFSFEG